MNYGRSVRNISPDDRLLGNIKGFHSYLCLIKTGFPLHFTVRVVPSAIPPTSNSADANASTSADGLILETNCKEFIDH